MMRRKAVIGGEDMHTVPHFLAESDASAKVLDVVTYCGLKLVRPVCHLVPFLCISTNCATKKNCSLSMSG